MVKNKKTNFAMTPELQKFQFEVAQEMGISTDTLAKANLGAGKKTVKTK